MPGQELRSFVLCQGHIGVSGARAEQEERVQVEGLTELCPCPGGVQLETGPHEDHSAQGMGKRGEQRALVGRDAGEFCKTEQLPVRADLVVRAGGS